MKIIHTDVLVIGGGLTGDHRHPQRLDAPEERAAVRLISRLQERDPEMDPAELEAVDRADVAIADAIEAEATCTLLLVRGGTRPSGLAPTRTLARFS